MSTLVVSIDRGSEPRRQLAADYPVVGWDSIEELALEAGIIDPEDSTVNRHLEALRVTRELEADNEGVIVAAVSGKDESMIGADRTIAQQIDELVSAYEPTGVIIVVDSAEDERLVPIIESRVRVDSVDRVVVRQIHDLESTYYLLKQFLADEELRTTLLVPIGVALVAFPVISMLAGTAIAVAAITAVIGGFLLYKGLGIDDYLEDLPAQARDAFYSGRVSIVTYVVAGGLALVGLFAGALGLSGAGSDSIIVITMSFVYHSVPWLALAAMTASTGRLFDEVIRSEQLSNAYLNLPFGVIAVGLVIRGFAAYFLQRATNIEPLFIPNVQIGTITLPTFPLTPEERLALFVIAGVLVSLVGVRIASYLSGTTIADPEPVE